jgi:putative endonuclease
MKQPALYMTANKKDGVIYTGVTSNLVQRIHEHKNKVKSKFSKKYNCDKLVYFEIYEDMEQAILREKQIKGGSRQKKIDMIEKENPQWNDLYDGLV